MPLLRRRGNMPHESDVRRHNSLPPDDAPDNSAETSASSQTVDAPALDELQGRASSATRPKTPLAQEENNRHKRFSILRFRNASDSQLSLRAKQQSEKPPPVPRREF